MALWSCCSSVFRHYQYLVLTTIKQAYNIEKSVLLKKFDTDETHAILDSLFSDYFNISKKDFIINEDKVFEKDNELHEIIIRLLDNEPLQHIIGFAWFKDLKIKVNSDVLIPRPETEELVNWIIEKNQSKTPKNIVDVCTGSGCIALSLAQHYKNSSVIGTDISKSALKIATENKTTNNLKNIDFIAHDILNETYNLCEPEIVVSNPPYIMATEKSKIHPNVLNYEPHLALFVNHTDDLLFYKKTLEQAAFRNSQFYFELNPLTVQELKVYCTEKQLKIETKFDIYGKERMACIER